MDGPVVQKVSGYALRPDDKDVMDALKAWFRVRYGRSVTQWELFSIVLACALSNEESLLAGALDDIG